MRATNIKREKHRNKRKPETRRNKIESQTKKKKKRVKDMQIDQNRHNDHKRIRHVNSTKKKNQD